MGGYCNKLCCEMKAGRSGQVVLETSKEVREQVSSLHPYNSEVLMGLIA